MSKSTRYLYAVLGIVWLWISAAAVVPSLGRIAVDKMHLQTPVFLNWAMVQFIPSMYNFGNQIWIGPAALTTDMIEGRQPLPPGTKHFWVNHYPLRQTYFRLRRDLLFKQYGTFYIYLKSSYRGIVWVQTYRMQVTPEGWTLVDEK